MKTDKTKLRTYTVVEVWRGIAAGAKNFRRLKEAQEYIDKLSPYKKMEDDAQIFETTVVLPTRARLRR